MAELKVEVVVAPSMEAGGSLLGVPLAAGATTTTGAIKSIDDLLGGVIAAALKRGDFRGEADETLTVYPTTDATRIERVVLTGLGKQADLGAEPLRRAIGQVVRQAEKLRVDSCCAVVDQVAEAAGLDAAKAAFVVAEAATMAAWNYRELKTSPDPDAVSVNSMTLFVSDSDAEKALGDAVRSGVICARAANFARDLAIRPGNIATPTFLAESAKSLADRFGLKLTVLDRAAMLAEGMHSLLAVAAGSEEEPRFIALEYHGGEEGAAPLVLIGKGVTFDAGGISIKPAERMEEMKFDMSGAAGVLGAMQGIAELGLRANVVALVPSTENLLSGRAVKPGDVVGSHLGKSIEVINTDAEGRLILVDALSWARRYEPAAMVDAATLTGAVVSALGHHAVGLMGNNDAVIAEVLAAGAAAGERCWQLPLWPEYRKQLDSLVADIKNTGGRPAGTITAAWFLREFAGDIPWAHLDIAGTAYRDEPAPYLRKGPTGVPARLFIEWVRSRSSG